VSRTDIMNWTRDYYKDTEFDMTLGVLAGPYSNPNRIEGGPGMLAVPGQFARGISIPRTAYSVVVEAKPGKRAGQTIAWFAIDQPLSSVFVPFVASSDRTADAYRKGRQEFFSRDSAWWAFNFVSNWMSIDWADMMAMHVGPAMREEQQRIMDAVQGLEADWPEDKEVVNRMQHGLHENLVKTWWALADELIARFSDGIYTHRNGTKKGIGYPGWWLQMIGFNDDFYRVQWVELSASPPALLLPSLPPALLRTASAAGGFLASTGGGGDMAALTAFIPGVLVGVAIGVALTAAALRKYSKAADLHARLLA